MNNIEENVTDQQDPAYSKHQFFLDHLWYAWKYNEIVGYLDLCFVGSNLCGDLWSVKKRRHNGGITKKEFTFRNQAFRKQVPRNKSSEEIFMFVIETLESLNKREYNKWYFDLDVLKVTGHFIDWVRLTNETGALETRKKYLPKQLSSNQKQHSMHFDINDLNEKYQHKGLLQIISELSAEVSHLDALFLQRKKLPELSRYKLEEYRKHAGDLLFFLNTGSTPGTIGINGLKTFLPIIKRLVTKGELNEDVLKRFNES